MPKLFTLHEYINATLDKGYSATSRAMFAQIAALTTGSGSAVQVSLRELDVEAERLQEAGERITPDNAQLEKTLNTTRVNMNTTEQMILANASEIEATGQEVAPNAVAAKLFMAVTAMLISRDINPVGAQAQAYYVNALMRANIGFTYPTSLDFVQDYTRNAAWIARMDGWGDGYGDLLGDVMRNGIQKGWSPIRTAREMRRLAENLPKSASENITRTLQLTSYRDASLAMEMLNGKYIERKIRIAELDEKTCAACIALHGTEMAVGERVDDHHNGRCDSILIPIGGSMPTSMQSDSTPGNRNFVPFQTGEEWFAQLSPERQAQQASFLRSPGKLNAYRDGVPLSQFVGEHTDPVFGRQVIEQSLKQSVADPELYYVRNEVKVE